MKGNTILVLAVPECHGRVSPVFDSCRKLLLFDLSQGRTKELGERDWCDLSFSKRALALKELGVSVLVCGGISRSLYEAVRGEGIEVVAFVAGGVADVVEAYKERVIREERFAMPGCRCWCSGRCKPEKRRPKC